MTSSTTSAAAKKVLPVGRPAIRETIGADNIDKINMSGRVRGGREDRADWARIEGQFGGKTEVDSGPGDQRRRQDGIGGKWISSWL